jgi:D-alanyl-lipoteichoic acid acyltransferase DltB (MBOAT superfamily)
MGFFKVAILSPLFAFAQDRCIAALTPTLPFTGKLVYGSLVVAIFPLYLYFNFSGYTDFVIGVARFLRLELPENFNQPFRSLGFIEFWSRWHMTLSNWLKTYVYSPFLLGLMRRFSSPRVEPAIGVLAYFVTFFLVGVWHGQTTMFLFFGVLQGLGVSVNKLYQILMMRRLGRAGYRALCANAIYASLSRGLTFAWFAFTLLWFWSTWGQLADFVSILGPVAATVALAALVLVAALILSGLELLRSRLGAVRALGSPYLKVAWFTALATVTISVTVVLNAPAPHIIYRAF